ncbi:MAG: Mrp/NBP35 family ATP-binding protein [Anaerolineae bacterium]|nr:Mrp/NBP35 family ATP-binding protein [Anaerolineae bacterium]
MSQARGDNPQSIQLDVTHLIAVTSGKGGVGKSTVASNLAVVLQKKGASVGLMDADITGPNLPLIMGLEGQRPEMGPDGLQPLEAFGIKVISMGFLVDPSQAIIWRGPMIHQAIRQLLTDVDWGHLDYLIVDLPPGTGDAQLTLAQSVPLTGALIVTQPQMMAVGDALRGLTMFEQVNVPILGVIENMSGDFFGEGGGEELASLRGVPFLGRVPLDPKVRVGGDTGTPIVFSDPESPAAQALVSIAERVADLSAAQDDGTIPISTIG